MGQIHTRMPVIVSELDWDRWLDPAITDISSFMPLLAPAPDDLLEAIPVGPRVNSVRNQGPELIEAVGPPLVVGDGSITLWTWWLRRHDEQLATIGADRPEAGFELRSNLVAARLRGLVDLEVACFIDSELR
jgi:hypothetical protein